MNTDGLTATFAEAFDSVWQAGIVFLPKLMTAALILVLGWGTAFVLRLVARRLSKRLPRMIPGRVVDRELRESGVERIAHDVVGQFVFWAVFLLFIAAAGHIIGLDMIPGALSRLVQYLPSVLAAVLVVFAGIILSKIAREGVARATRRAEIAQGEFLAQAIRVTILLVTGVVALDQIGIESALLILVLGIVLGSVVGGVALAFGLGARDSVRGFIATQDLTQSYRVGDRVVVGEIQGQIIEFTRTAVVLDTEQGRARMPSVELIGRPSILMEAEDS